MNHEVQPASPIVIPPSLRRKSKEPMKTMQFSVPQSWWQELTDLSREFDQDIATFLREATEEWLVRARLIRRQTDDNSINASS